MLFSPPSLPGLTQMPRAAHLQPYPLILDAFSALPCTVQFFRPPDPVGHITVVTFKLHATHNHTILFPWPASAPSLLVYGRVLNLPSWTSAVAVCLFCFIFHTFFHSHFFSVVPESKMTHHMYSAAFVLLMTCLCMKTFPPSLLGYPPMHAAPRSAR